MVSQKVHDALKAFTAEREWDQFHTPENLAKSISIEAGELLECFQWNSKPDLQNVRHELADVLTYCLHLARAIGADPEQIILEKLEITRKKYPVEKAKGKNLKGVEESDIEDLPTLARKRRSLLVTAVAIMVLKERPS